MPTINGKEIDRITEVNKDWIAETLNELLTSLDGLSFEKKEKQNCIECGELVGEHEIIKNCHGSCRVEI